MSQARGVRLVQNDYDTWRRRIYAREAMNPKPKPRVYDPVFDVEISYALHNEAEREKFRKPSMICAKCQNMFNGYFKMEICFPRYYESYAALKAAAEKGCGACVQALESIDLDDLHFQEAGTVDITYSGAEPGRIYLTIPFTKAEMVDFGCLSLEEAKKRDDKEMELLITLQFRPTRWGAIDYDGPQPSTRDALGLCKTWLEKCCTSHDCLPSNRPRHLPTRLITIDSQPRIVLSEELGTKLGVRFAALSHCWGGQEFTTLRRENIEEFRRRIPTETLPKTFRDAIEICRYVGLPYLWIDSLCIIQRDKEDWDRESHLMTAVYGNCDLNISAASAKNGSVGCFFERKKSWRCQAYAKQDRPTELYDVFDPKRVATKRDVLEERAWVIQERYLSRRILHFTRHQVFWECITRSHSEIFPVEFPVKIRCREKNRYAISRRNLTQVLWPSIVGNYSQAHLTRSSDKLAAIAGLARVIYERQIKGIYRRDDASGNSGYFEVAKGSTWVRDRYITGLWLSHVPKKFLWTRKQHSELRRRLSGFTCPTWSWIPIDGPVLFEELACKGIDLHYLEVDYVDPNNPFGDVKNAVLRLRCDSLWPGTIYSPSFEYMQRIIWDCNSFQRDVVGINWDSLDFLENEVRLSQPLRVFFMPIETIPVHTCGLVLKETQTRNGEYVRVGSFCFDVYERPFLLCSDPDPIYFSGEVEDKNSGRRLILDLV
ncbi:heterokaryon incompatibility protein-domain-containing protein [Hypoxylon trugodes]|uniref:heterokaryon incompatibility protein-domain-containing protein n=1 Tax=Hypoxylon trugodes TaxID=326681 RepID=UPI002191E359|nr:heterokaryon incompatibility protein-domain-containing protein [Hypoxylon trugodes]KAI1391810.1 heterokaryon incompatibility protein-domain-containing protein [Hypoxylon trugodes]